jgi:DNA-binding NarL/FixJ family response regulator
MHLLIADDHPFTLLGTKNFIESLGYHVQYICSNGITALNHIKSHRVQLAILDINMPGLDGLDVLTEIKKQKTYKKQHSYRFSDVPKISLNLKLLACTDFCGK